MTHHLSTFDPDAPAEGDGIFGLPHTVDDARVRICPVPWQGTASFGKGTQGAPEAVAEASRQVDLYHPVYGDDVWRAGIAMAAPDPRFRAWAVEAAARPVPSVVNPISEAIDAWVAREVRDTLVRGQVPAVLGGEHSVALGGIRAALEHHPDLGILHVDAHADLRDAYEGFTGSHASVMHNVLASASRDVRLVQVGLRDLGRAEQRRIDDDDRIIAWHDRTLSEAMLTGATWGDLVDDILRALPETIWISFDVDGLDPSLCPDTGTPVPGGLSWTQAVYLLRQLVVCGHRVVGFDLCELGAAPWDANVGARLLYELAATANASNPYTCGDSRYSPAARAALFRDPSEPTMTIRDFMSEHYLHFNSREVVEAAKAWESHIQAGGKMVITLAGAMSTARVGKLLARLIREGWVHGVSCTGANLEEDIFALLESDGYERIPDWRALTAEHEKALLDRGMNRVTDTCIPETVMRHLERRLLDAWSGAADAGEVLSPAEMIWTVLEDPDLAQHYQIDPAESWVLACKEMGIPIWTPGWEDSTTGNMFAAAVWRGDVPHHNVVKTGTAQMQHLMQWYVEATQGDGPGVGFFQIGGGIAGDFAICSVPALVQDLHMDVPTWSYFCQISDAVTSYGGYSGAVPNEKITWGKLDVDTPKFMIQSDATIVAPLIFAWLLGL